jgi:hypothetical protein
VGLGAKASLAAPSAPSCSVAPCGPCLAPNAKYMVERPEDKAAALNARIHSFAAAYTQQLREQRAQQVGQQQQQQQQQQEAGQQAGGQQQEQQQGGAGSSDGGADTELQGVCEASQEEVHVVGRVLCDSERGEGPLNAASVVLQGDVARGSSARLELAQLGHGCR